jgi:hypothetical protein
MYQHKPVYSSAMGHSFGAACVTVEFMLEITLKIYGFCSDTNSQQIETICTCEFLNIHLGNY